MQVIVLTIISLLLCAVGISVILFLNKQGTNKNFVNLLLSGSALLFYICLLFREGSFREWNIIELRVSLPLSKMSPFIFSTAFFVNFLPALFKKYYFSYISFLLLPMLLVGCFGSLVGGIMNDINYFVPWMYFDSFSHIFVFLFGFWILITGQVSTEKKTLFIDILVTHSFLVLIIFINLITHLDFFGLSVYGGHNIYGVVINPWLLSFFIYFSEI